MTRWNWKLSLPATSFRLSGGGDGLFVTTHGPERPQQLIRSPHPIEQHSAQVPAEVSSEQLNRRHACRTIPLFRGIAGSGHTPGRSRLPGGRLPGTGGARVQMDEAAARVVADAAAHLERGGADLAEVAVREEDVHGAAGQVEALARGAAVVVVLHRVG